MIIIPDIHGRDFWEKPVRENLGKKHIIFLDDYLDPYDNEGIAHWEVFPRFEEIMALKKVYPECVTLLLGNHDLHYLDSRLKGDRYDYMNCWRNRALLSENAALFQMAFEISLAGKKLLFTHAGVLQGWMEKNKALLGGAQTVQIGGRLNDYWQNRGNWPRLFTILADVPYSRCGDSRYGSPIWSDVDDMDDSGYEIPDNYQIFGHTQQETDPVIGNHYACLDCRKAFRLTEEAILEPYVE